MTTKSGRILVLNSAEEDAAINVGIAADPDTYELSDEEFAQLRPIRLRTKYTRPKVHSCVRLDPSLIEAFKATGEGGSTHERSVARMAGQALLDQRLGRLVGIGLYLLRRSLTGTGSVRSQSPVWECGL